MSHLPGAAGRFVLAQLTAIALLAGASPWAAAEPRTPKVAGRFYPANQAELLDLVSGLLDRQPKPPLAQKPRLLIVPHAGYPYSGPVAASAFRRIEGQTYDAVVVVAFTHRIQFDGASVDTRESYLTPLGELPVDQEAVAILQTYPGIRHVEEVHQADEHSLEVELPFLQVALEHVRLVPVLIGNISLDDAQHLANALAALSRLGDYLFVFSTDLSHYHPYAEAMRIDERTVNSLLFETPQAVHRLFERGEIEACGRGPIVTSLLLADRLGHLKRELVFYANSGDTAGNPSSVVGYAALAMFDRPPETVGRLSPQAGAVLVETARASIEQSFTPSSPPPTISVDRYPELARAAGVFVTLRKRGVLRGCIGRIETSDSLGKAVPMVAQEAAFRDPRFSPLRQEELQDIHVEVSVLTPPTKLAHLEELVPGEDGVILEHEGHRGVFLPQVWEETGWTRVEFLRELASQKAGLPPEAWQQAALYVFQDQIFEEP